MDLLSCYFLDVISMIMFDGELMIYFLCFVDVVYVESKEY